MMSTSGRFSVLSEKGKRKREELQSGVELLRGALHAAIDSMAEDSISMIEENHKHLREKLERMEKETIVVEKASPPLGKLQKVKESLDKIVASKTDVG